ncbi:hypothetical protein [Celeribacter arenosi]|uniref:hypothetical protein n=1 Tax=Celeribacter arenosi TaxID=792649 RepID=UPI0031E48340
MVGFFRFLIIGFIALSVLYGLLVLYVRSLTRERLEDEWAEEGSIGDLDTYVKEGMDAYEKSFLPKLLLLVYVLPLIAFCVIFYIMNFS